MNIYVVVPAFNESHRIAKVLSDLLKTKLPVVVVDDGSKDNTFENVKRFKVNLLRHRTNLGKGAAIKTGCLAAFKLGAEAVIMMDSDGQHLVADLNKFKEILSDKKTEVVFGTRDLTSKSPLVRVWGNKFASLFISWLFNIYVSDLLCGYRAFTRKAFEKMDLQSSGYGIETEMVVRVGQEDLKYCEVPVQTIYYDKFKGVTILDALEILFSVMKWRIIR